MEGTSAAGQDIVLYASPGLTSYRVLIALEELGLRYRAQEVSKEGREDRTEWFLALNPTGTLPVLVDGADKKLVLTEPAASLLYLVDTYDAELRISFPRGTAEYYEALNWVGFAATVQAAQEQLYFMVRYAWVEQPHAKLRSLTETRRLYKVLDTHLSRKGPAAWLVGDRFSIADIACFTWAHGAAWTGLDIAPFPAVKAWTLRVLERAAVQRALCVPRKFFLTEEFIKDPANAELMQDLGSGAPEFMKLDWDEELQRQAGY